MPNPSNQSGTGYTNLQDYQKANENNQLGDTLASGINQTVSNDQQDLNNAQTDFNNQATNTGSASDVSAATGILNKLQQDPNSLSDQDYNQFADYVNGYTGASGLSNADTLQSQAQDANQLGQDVNDTYGRLGLLQRFVGGNGQYTAGEQYLDNSLIGNNDKLNQARQNSLGLLAQTNNAVNTAQQQAQDYTARGRQFGQGLQTNVSNQLTGLQNTLNQQLANTPTGATLNSQIVSDYNNPNGLTSQDLAALQSADTATGSPGLVLGSHNFGIDPTNAEYLNSTSVAPTLSQVASPTQLAMNNALARLSGNASATLQAPTSAYTPGLSFNNAAYNQAVQNKQTAFINGLNSIQMTLPSGTTGAGGDQTMSLSDYLTKPLPNAGGLTAAQLRGDTETQQIVNYLLGGGKLSNYTGDQYFAEQAPSEIQNLINQYDYDSTVPGAAPINLGLDGQPLNTNSSRQVQK